MPEKKLSSIRELFQRNKRDLLRYLTRRVGREDAPDLLQETFARALRYDEFAAVADPPAYMRQTAANLATDFGRRRNSETKVLVFDAASHDAPSNELSPQEHVEISERGRMLAGAIEALPPRCREVFTMRMHEDIPQDEIARRLGITRKMVDRHLQIAIQRCRAALK
jgi:RNA polymerase sigma factor (sigma-70 family)